MDSTTDEKQPLRTRPRRARKPAAPAAGMATQEDLDALSCASLSESSEVSESEAEEGATGSGSGGSGSESLSSEEETDDAEELKEREEVYEENLQGGADVYACGSRSAHARGDGKQTALYKAHAQKVREVRESTKELAKQKLLLDSTHGGDNQLVEYKDTRSKRGSGKTLVTAAGGNKIFKWCATDPVCKWLVEFISTGGSALIKDLISPPADARGHRCLKGGTSLITIPSSMYERLRSGKAAVACFTYDVNLRVGHAVCVVLQLSQEEGEVKSSGTYTMFDPNYGFAGIPASKRSYFPRIRLMQMGGGGSGLDFTLGTWSASAKEGCKVAPQARSDHFHSACMDVGRNREKGNCVPWTIAICSWTKAVETRADFVEAVGSRLNQLASASVVHEVKGYRTVLRETAQQTFERLAKLKPCGKALVKRHLVRLTCERKGESAVTDIPAAGKGASDCTDRRIENSTVGVVAGTLRRFMELDGTPSSTSLVVQFQDGDSDFWPEIPVGAKDFVPVGVEDEPVGKRYAFYMGIQCVRGFLAIKYCEHIAPKVRAILRAAEAAAKPLEHITDFVVEVCKIFRQCHARDLGLDTLKLIGRAYRATETASEAKSHFYMHRNLRLQLEERVRHSVTPGALLAVAMRKVSDLDSVLGAAGYPTAKGAREFAAKTFKVAKMGGLLQLMHRFRAIVGEAYAAHLEGVVARCFGGLRSALVRRYNRQTLRFCEGASGYIAKERMLMNQHRVRMEGATALVARLKAEGRRKRRRKAVEEAASDDDEPLRRGGKRQRRAEKRERVEAMRAIQAALRAKGAVAAVRRAVEEEAVEDAVVEAVQLAVDEEEMAQG